MDIWTLSAFTFAYAISVVVPGPGIASVVGRALGGGFWSAVPLIAGIWAGDLIVMGLAAFGLAAVAAYFSPIFVFIRFAGAAYLLYIAFKFWTAKTDGTEVQAANDKWLKTFLTGISVTLGNPKTLIFFLALMPTVIPLEKMNALAFLELACIVTLTLPPIHCCYAALTSHTRDLFKSPKALRRLNKSAACIMTAAAGAVALR